MASFGCEDEIGRRPQRDVHASGAIETYLAAACPECDPVHAEVHQVTLAVRHVGPASLHGVDPLSVGQRTVDARVGSGKTDPVVGDAGKSVSPLIRVRNPTLSV